MAEAIDPTDIFEWLWVKEVADLTWEVNRARRALAAHLNSFRQQAIVEILERANGPPSYAETVATGGDPNYYRARGALTNDPTSRERLDSALDRLGLPEQAIDELAYARGLVTIERLQHMADTASRRRDSVLREIERKRDDAGKRARAAASEADRTVDAEFSVPPEPNSGR